MSRQMPAWSNARRRQRWWYQYAWPTLNANEHSHIATSEAAYRLAVKAMIAGSRVTYT